MTEQSWQGAAPPPEPATAPEAPAPAPTGAPEPSPAAPAAELRQEPEAPATHDVTPDEPVDVAELQRQVAELQARVAAATPSAVHTATVTSPVVGLPVADLPEQVDVAHAIAPGSAGSAVRELAALLETLGEKTYLTRGGNADDVFEDELMASVKRVVTGYVRDNAHINELETKLRDVAMLNHVAGDTWRIVRHLADQTAKAAA